MLRSSVGAIEDLELGRLLGRGGFAEVYEGGCKSAWHAGCICICALRAVLPHNNLTCSPCSATPPGTWEGIAVAVKVAKTTVSVGQSLDLSAEPMLSVAVSHPNVLPTYRTCVVRCV